MMPQGNPPYREGDREMKRRLREDMTRIEAEAELRGAGSREAAG